MSAIERGFVPLRRMEEEQPSDKFFVNLNLPPYVDRDRIGVDLARIHRLCKIAGINRILLIGESGQETSTVIPQIAGYNPDGSALASRAVAVVNVPTFDSKTTQEGKARTDSRLIDISVTANMDEIGLRVADSREGLRSANEWAKHLDGGLRHAVRRGGTSNLLRNRPHFNPDLPAITASSIIVLDISDGNPDGLLILGETFVYGLSRFFSKSMTLNNPDHRISLIPGPQIDRAIWFNLVLATGKLIKDMYPDKKLPGKP